MGLRAEQPLQSLPDPSSLAYLQSRNAVAPNTSECDCNTSLSGYGFPLKLPLPFEEREKIALKGGGLVFEGGKMAKKKH